MRITDSAGAEVGLVTVTTSQDGGHSLEYFAELIVRRLIYVGDGAPEPIKAQALAYQDALYAVVLDGLQRAIASDRAYRK